MVTHACIPALVETGGLQAWASGEFKASLSNRIRPCLIKEKQQWKTQTNQSTKSKPNKQSQNHPTLKKKN